MEGADVCDDWEQLTQDTARLEKQLEKFSMDQPTSRPRGEPEGPSEVTVGIGERSDASLPITKGNQPQFRLLLRNKDSVPAGIHTRSVELESGSEDSLRTQYAPPQPTLKILTRPKHSSHNANAGMTDRKSQVSTKSLKQREKEYSEARMRILGDVRFLEEEKEAALEETMSPAEILKMKVNQSLLADEKMEETEDVLRNETKESSLGVPTTTTVTSKRKSRARTPIVTPPTHFPLSKTDFERIKRQPRGPDGTPGFSTPR